MWPTKCLGVFRMSISRNYKPEQYKVPPVCREGTGGCRVIATPYLILALEGVTGQRNAPAGTPVPIV